MKKRILFALILASSLLTVAAAPTAQVAPDIAERLKQLPDTPIDYDHSLLNANEKNVVRLLIEASHYMDELFWRQVSMDNQAARENLVKLAKTKTEYRPALKYMNLMKGRWDRLKKEEPFAAPFEKKPEGAGFYPPDMSKQEFEKWIADHPADKEKFQGLFTVIHRQGKNLIAVPYSQEYKLFLEPAAKKLREAAALTEEASLRNYLNKLADAFFKDNYYESDVAWMDLNSDIEVVIGPYEVYEDELFNYKAAFESFVTVMDKSESEKLVVYAKHLPDMEKNLPIPDEHKNPNRGSESPIRVVQEIYTAGDARRGVQTSAFNLPNDEKVRETKGSKKVLLKNVMEAKFKQCGQPIARRVFDESQLSSVTFDAYFNETLFHELSHGVGPGIITGPDGKKVDNRILLKELYSSIEECKADVVGMWNLFYVIDKGILTSLDKKTVIATNAALHFRSMRFGIDEAHGRGTAVQWNWYREKGAIVPAEGGRFRVDFAKYEQAVKSLANELLMIEAIGSYDRAQKLLDKYGKSSQEMESTIQKLKDIPVDIAPVFLGAGEK